MSMCSILCVSLAGVGVSPQLGDVAVPSSQGQGRDLELLGEFFERVYDEAPSVRPAKLSLLLRLDDVHVCECVREVTLNHEGVVLAVGRLQVEAEVADHSVNHVNEVAVLCEVEDGPNRCLCGVEDGGGEFFHVSVCFRVC